jgi:hypothetical protein
MAQLYSVTSGAVALTAATARTLIEIATGATIDNVWVSFDITFDGVTATAVPVKVDIISTTASGTGTTYTPVKIGNSQNRASITTAEIATTVEGSTPTVLLSWYVPPTSGFSYQWPLGRELGQTVSKFFGIRCTAPAGVNAIANLLFEE